MVLTGQHPHLDPADFGLNCRGAVHLDCPGQPDPHVHAGAVTRALVPVLARFAPDLVVVQGDTSSALGGALAAKLAGLPLAHVEAGLRSHDPHRPWPEEEFRIAIDKESDLLFAATELSAANLRRERVRGAIHITGNSGIDAVLAVRDRTAPESAGGSPRLLVTCHRRENWGGGIAGLAAALGRIAEQELAAVEVLLHPNPANAAQMRQMLLGYDGIAFRQPCSHAHAVAAMLESDLVLSDSGGIQEEAAALGVPLLVLRDKTERPEAIASGAMELVGTNPDAIVGAVRRRLCAPVVSEAGIAFGDGRASKRIAEVISEWLANRPPATHGLREAPAMRPQKRRRTRA